MSGVRRHRRLSRTAPATKGDSGSPTECALVNHTGEHMGKTSHRRRDRTATAASAPLPSIQRMSTEMLGTTLDDLMRDQRISVSDKERAFVCYKRMTSAARTVSRLMPSDAVTLVGLDSNVEINGQTGTLGDFDANTQRWEVLGPNVRVRERNIIANKWHFEGNFNTSVGLEGKTYIVRITPDKAVWCLTPEGTPGEIVCMKSPFQSLWSEGFDRNAPERSVYDAWGELDRCNPFVG